MEIRNDDVDLISINSELISDFAESLKCLSQEQYNFSKDVFVNEATNFCNLELSLCKLKKSTLAYELQLMQTTKELINHWDLNCNQQTQNLKAFLNGDHILKWYAEKQKDDWLNKQDSHNFNILSIFWIDELKHSELIRLLLDSRGNHGQGNLFLDAFLEQIGIKEPYNGQWQVTIEEGKIDILLKRENPLSVVIIENKAKWATDMPNQLYRYWYKAIFKETKKIDRYFYETNKDIFQIVYLAPSGKMYDTQTITKPNNSEIYRGMPSQIPMTVSLMTFGDHLIKWLDVCILKLPPDNHRMREYLKQYKEICKTL